MGGAESSRKEAGNSSDSDVAELVPTVTQKSEIEEVFGWYDSTDSDISELQYTPRKKSGSKDGCGCNSKASQVTTSGLDGSGDKNVAEKSTITGLIGCGCCNTGCVRYFHDKDDTTPEATSSSCECSRDTTSSQTPPERGAFTSHEPIAISNYPMNIEKKRNTLDRYSREPPERDQNYESGFMKVNEGRRDPYEHSGPCGGNCPCKTGDIKAARTPSDYSAHAQYSQHNPHNPHTQHSQHSPHSLNSHNPQSQHSAHAQHSQHAPPQYNQMPYNTTYQDYQQYNQPQQLPQQSSSHFNKQPGYNQQPAPNRRCLPNPPSFPERKARTTYDMAKSAENLRQNDQGKVAPNNHPPQPKSASHSSPDVGKHKMMQKQDHAKSDSSDNYGYVETHSSKYPYEEPMQDREEPHDRNCACDYCHHLRRNYFMNCKCCDCRKPYDDQPSYADDNQHMNQHMNNRNVNLAYQKTEDYPVLVDEIETTISLRNKERVRNTMRQFELLSRQNKGLEKPIYDDEEDDSSNGRYCPRSSSPSYNTRCSNIQTKSESLSSRPAFAATPFPRSRGYVEKVARFMDPALNDNAQKYTKFNSEQTNTRWQMDQRTGEWYKVYDDSNYDFQNNYPPLPEPPSSQFRDQEYSKSCNQNYYNGSQHSQQLRSGTPNKHHHHHTMHTKSCSCRSCMQGRY